MHIRGRMIVGSKQSLLSLPNSLPFELEKLLDRFINNEFAKLGERPTILDSHSDKVLKDFIDQKRDEKMYKKV